MKIKLILNIKKQDVCGSYTVFTMTKTVESFHRPVLNTKIKLDSGESFYVHDALMDLKGEGRWEAVYNLEDGRYDIMEVIRHKEAYTKKGWKLIYSDKYFYKKYDHILNG